MRFWWILASFSCSGSLFAASLGCEHSADALRCVKYVRNYDADTLTVDIAGLPALFGDKVSVRVKGVDAPEIKTKNACEKTRAKEARQFVASTLKTAKRIDLIGVERDKYFRILAEVMVDGKSLADLLEAKGFVYDYDGGTKRKVDWCHLQRKKK